MMRRGSHKLVQRMLCLDVLEDRTVFSLSIFASAPPESFLALSRPVMKAIEPTSTDSIIVHELELAPNTAAEVNPSVTVQPESTRSILRTSASVSEPTNAVGDADFQSYSLTDESKDESFTNDSTGIDGRPIVKGIHARHPEWQVDTAWVNGGDFTVGTFLDWWTNATDSTADGDLGPELDNEPSTDLGLSNGNYQQPSNSIDESAGPQDGSPFAESAAPSSSVTDAKPVAAAVKASETTVSAEPSRAYDFVMPLGAPAQSPSSAIVSGREHQIGIEESESQTNGVQTGWTSRYQSENLVSAPHSVTSEAEFIEVALVVARVAEGVPTGAMEEVVFAPHEAGLQTQFSTLDALGFGIAAFGEGVGDFFDSIFELDVQTLLGTCFMAIVAAGLGAEIVRRRYQKARPACALATVEWQNEPWLIG